MRSPLQDLVGADRTTVPELIAARAQATPERTFLRWRGAEWTYAEMLAEARRFAGWALGNTRSSAAEHRVASFLPNRPEAIWAWFGSLLAGATYVSLNREHRGVLLLDMLARSQAETLVTDSAGLEALPDLGETSVHTVLVADMDAPPRASTAPRLADWGEVRRCAPADGPDVRPGDAAVLLYTSGTTGRSKAVLTPHNQACRGAAWVCWSLGITADDVIHGWLPLCHTGGQVDVVLPLLIAGGTVALYPTFSRSRFWSEVAESRATIFIGFSNVVEILWALPADPADRDCTLRAGIMGGIPPRLHRPFEERFGVRLHDIFGMSEAEPLILPRPGEAYPVGSCGRASPDFDVVVFDDDDSPVARGELGELVFRPRTADVMMKGYEGDDRATLEASRSLWFHTGDRGRMDADGFLYFVDRRIHSIRRRGENISSWELESVISRHPSVEECCAVGVPSPLGEEDVKVAVVPRAGAGVEPVTLHEWCREQMAGFMVPRYIEVLTELPRTSLGKLLKDELARNGPGTWDADAGRIERAAGHGASSRSSSG